MDKSKKRQQQQQESDFNPRRPADEGRRTKMRMGKEITDSSGKNSNCTSSSLYKQPQPNGEGGSTGRSPRPGFDPQTNDNLYKTSARSPNLPPQLSVNETKVVNWRLACCMCNEYLTLGTLLGRPWPTQDSKPNWHENNGKSQPKSGSLDQDGDESRREKERLYHTLADFLQAGDVHLPGIVNPSQLAAWLGL
jgi:hypothetical protein